MVTTEEAALEAIGAVSILLEVAAAVTIVTGAAVALVRGLPLLLRRQPLREVRRRFGAALLLGLDFAIGGDVLRVSSAPSLTAVAITGGVVLVRIALTLILLHELRQEHRVRD